MLHLVRSYFKFLWKSSNQHGVHSPFVYQLVTRCFYDKKSYPAYALLSRYRKALRNNTKSIKVNDLGSGSRVFTSEERKIAAIAKNAGITPKRARLLNRLVRYLEVENALELGTSLGMGTAALAAKNEIQVQSIEGCAVTAAVAEEHFRKFGLDNVALKIGEFEEVLDTLLGQKKGPEGKEPKTRKAVALAAVGKATEAATEEEIAKVTDEEVAVASLKSAVLKESCSDNTSETSKASEEKTLSYSLVYFDGNHQKQATLTYFERLLPFAHNDSVFIFDDIHWSAQMEEAWEEIKAHPSVRVSIDTFQWGLVFFRKEQEKEHFVIRV